jgi:hypothetical protein
MGMHKKLAVWRLVTDFLSRLAPRQSMLGSMAEVTRLSITIEAGDPWVAADLLTLVSDELRGNAAARMATKKLNQYRHATARVQETDLRLVGNDATPGWNGRGQPPTVRPGPSHDPVGRRLTTDRAE